MVKQADSPLDRLVVKLALATLRQWNESQLQRLLGSLHPEEIALLDNYLAEAQAVGASRTQRMLLHDWSDFLEAHKQVLSNDEQLQRIALQIPRELLVDAEQPGKTRPT